MIDNEQFLATLQQKDIQFFAGVPDSLLKQICACITDRVEPHKHIITANEGAAISLASGHYLATGEIPLVYLQNSGLGNMVNPLLSLADPEVYSIPMIVMIGWRGEPGVKDEPQHIKQGRVQNDILEAMEMPYEIIDADSRDYDQVIARLVGQTRSESRPVALVVKKGTFAPYEFQNNGQNSSLLNRETALLSVVNNLQEEDIVVSTTGMSSRELFEIRAQKEMGHHRDFLTVGSMGHCSQIALGIAMEKQQRTVYCIDGDGAVLMHMGSLAIIGNQTCSNYKHIVLNNGAHDSVGGQPTVGFSIDLPAIAKACGYKEAKRAVNQNEIEQGMQWLLEVEGPAMLEIQVHKGARKDLGRPTRTPIENKMDLMENLNR